MTNQAYRIFCVGRNYQAHIEELNSKRPTHPVIFMKPSSSIVPIKSPIIMPSFGKVLHHEAEIVIQIARAGRAKSTKDAKALIGACGLGLDLTLRDVQAELKQKGHPWEIAKSFDGSAPCGPLIPVSPDISLDDLHFSCHVNGQQRQSGHSAELLFSIPTIIVYLSQLWTLKPGDLIYTGTPQGVGPLHPGDRITLSSHQLPDASWDVVQRQP